MKKPYLCQWFLFCTRPAAGTVKHPILGQVPCCLRCVDSLGMHKQFTPTPEPTV